MVEETTDGEVVSRRTGLEMLHEGKGKGERRGDLTSQLTLHYPQDMVNMDNKNATFRDSYWP